MSVSVEWLREQKDKFYTYEFWDGPYVLKPFYHEHRTWWERIRDSWLVLMGKSFAIHYWEDHRCEYLD